MANASQRGKETSKDDPHHVHSSPTTLKLPNALQSGDALHKVQIRTGTRHGQEGSHWTPHQALGSDSTYDAVSWVQFAPKGPNAGNLALRVEVWRKFVYKSRLSLTEVSSALASWPEDSSLSGWDAK